MDWAFTPPGLGDYMQAAIGRLSDIRADILALDLGNTD